MDYKFRVWIFDQNKMYYPDNEFHILSNNKLFKLDPHIEESRYFDMKFKKLKSMLHTGINDWWEYDILGFKDADDLAVVVWNNGGFKLQYYTNGEPSKHREGDLFFAKIDQFHIDNMIVKGNFFENSNLLKSIN